MGERDIDKKREEVVGFIKGVFSGDKKENDKEHPEKKDDEKNEHHHHPHKQEENKEEINIKEKREELIKFFKQNPLKILYIFFALQIPLGLILLFGKLKLPFVAKFIPFPLTNFSFAIVFVIIPLISLVLIKYKRWGEMILMYLMSSGFLMRMQNISLLKDVTTGKYIPLALDPHNFMRYAEYIAEHGKLYAVDALRYFDFGAKMRIETVILPYFIVGIQKILAIFSNIFTIDFVHIIYPPIAFAISLIFFYLLIIRLFNTKIAVIATSILIVIPPYLYRTMAGFSDKESLGMLLLFMTLYFLVEGWQSKDTKKAIGFGLLSGIFTGLMGYSWGGVNLLFLLIGGFAFVEILLGKFDKKFFYVYASWVIGMFLLLNGYLFYDYGGARFGYKILLGSFTSGLAIFAFFIALVDFFLFQIDIIKIKKYVKGIAPYSVLSLLIAVVLAFSGMSVIEGPQFFAEKYDQMVERFFTPYGTTRWHLTVAEGHQPYFTSWLGQMGWHYIIFFLLGSVYLFYETVKPIGKRRFELTALYALFIWAFIFSRYSQGSQYLNGVSPTAKFLYAGSLVIFSSILGILFLYSYYKDKATFENINKIERKYIFIFIWFLLMVVAARGAERNIFIFAPITAVLAAYFLYSFVKIAFNYVPRLNDKVYRVAGYIIIAIVIMFAFWPLASTVNKIPLINKIPVITKQGFLLNFADQTMSQGKYTGPSYNTQWQLAGQWVRDNTPKPNITYTLDERGNKVMHYEGPVFAHWWDYGYWVQNGFQRATLLDGANLRGLWNYFMGRNVLTAENQTEALSFLKTRNLTHLLIISDEIGKYTAYSSIGGGVNYERYSWITPFTLNQENTQETRNQTVYMYQGSYVLDEDFTYDGHTFPGQGSGVGAVFIPTQNIEVQVGEGMQLRQIINQPTLAMVHGGQRFDVPIKCLYTNKQMIKFPGEGYEGCFRVMPTITGNGQMNPFGAGLFVSKRGVNALWTQLFLFEQNDPDYDTSAFKLIYNDEDRMPLALYNGRQIGPFKIWEMDYPEDTPINEDYLARSYEQLNLTAVTKV
jgi:asparagine N-glycosylation enzyme membrane subunit Stt3